MRVRISFFLDVPEDFVAKHYGTAVSYVRTILHRVGLRTSVWHIEYDPPAASRHAINCNGPTGTPS